MQKVIVYRSQTEQAQDEFIQMIFQWIATNPWVVIIGLVAVIVFFCLVNSSKRRY